MPRCTQRPHTYTFTHAIGVNKLDSFLAWSIFLSIYSGNRSMQEALNIWRGKLFLFFSTLDSHMYPKVILISIVDLQKTNNFAKFGGCIAQKMCPPRP